MKRTIPEFTWAVFPCVGRMPDALQDVNTKIFTEWLPALKEYELNCRQEEMMRMDRKWSKEKIDKITNDFYSRFCDTDIAALEPVALTKAIGHKEYGIAYILEE